MRKLLIILLLCSGTALAQPQTAKKDTVIIEYSTPIKIGNTIYRGIDRGKRYGPVKVGYLVNFPLEIVDGNAEESIRGVARTMIIYFYDAAGGLHTRRFLGQIPAIERVINNKAKASLQRSPARGGPQG